MKQIAPFLLFHKRMEDGRVFPFAQVLRIVRAAKARPSAWFAQTLRSSWHGGSGQEIVSQFRQYVRDEINRRAGLVLIEPQPHRIERRLARERAMRGSECRWCGSRIPWQPLHARFCEASCRRSFSC